MRAIANAFVSAVLAAVLAGLSWALLFAKFTDVPSEAAYPGNWSALSVDAQNQWLFAHSVNISGFAAILHIFENVRTYLAPLLGFLGVLFICALGALAINAFLQRRAP